MTIMIMTTMMTTANMRMMMTNPNRKSGNAIYWPLRTALVGGGVMASLLGAQLLAQSDPYANTAETTETVTETSVTEPVLVMAQPQPTAVPVTYELPPLDVQLPPIPTVASPPERDNTAVTLQQQTAAQSQNNYAAPPPVDTSFTLNLAPVPTLAPPPPPRPAAAPQVVVTQSNSSR